MCLLGSICDPVYCAKHTSDGLTNHFDSFEIVLDGVF